MADEHSRDERTPDELRQALLRSEERRLRDREALELAARKSEERLRASDLALEDQRRQLSELAGQVSALDRITRDLEAQARQGREELEGAREAERKLTRRMEELSRERNNLRQAVEEAHDDREQLEKARDELREVKQVRNQLREEVASMWLKIEEKDKEIRGVKDRLAEADSRALGPSPDELARAVQEGQGPLHARIVDLEAQLSSRDRAWTELEELVRRSEAEKSELLQEIQTRSGEVEALRGEIRSLKAAKNIEQMKTAGRFKESGDMAVAELRMELGELDL